MRTSRAAGGRAGGAGSKSRLLVIATGLFAGLLFVLVGVIATAPHVGADVKLITLPEHHALPITPVAVRPVPPTDGPATTAASPRVTSVPKPVAVKRERSRFTLPTAPKETQPPLPTKLVRSQNHAQRFDDRDEITDGPPSALVRTDNIHAKPLGVPATTLSARKPSLTSEAWKGNIIAEQYLNVKPLSDKDPIRARFRGEVWNGREGLADLLGRWIVINREMRAGKRPARIVSVNPVGQLCNRLMAITSGFVFALITGRGLHIDDSGFYCAMSDLFETPGFDWVNLAYADLGDSHMLQNPDSGVWEETEPLLCGDYSKTYNHKSIIFSINQYLVPYIASNPLYRTALDDLFGGLDIFTPSSHFLYQPIKDVLDMRDKYIMEHFKGRFVVGMQVRSGSDFTDNFMSNADWDLYGRCAEGVTPAHMSSKLKLFIATDTQQGRDAAVKQFGKDKVMFGPGEFLLSNHPRGVQMALLDLLLLAAANDRVTTAWSSYGYFAAGFSGFPAATVVDQVTPDKWIAKAGEEQRFMGVPHKSDKRRQCVRLPVHQPCFHKYASWGADHATCFNQQWYEREMLNGSRSDWVLRYRWRFACAR